jgi:hypothetical protein
MCAVQGPRGPNHGNSAARLRGSPGRGRVVLIGWVVLTRQWATDDVSGGGSVWLTLFAVAATVGAVVVFGARDVDQHGLRAVGLAAAAVSPTVFAYPLNVLVGVLAVVELVAAVSGKRRTHELVSKP